MRDWLNAFHGYVQYTHEVTEKELLLISLYGSFFRQRLDVLDGWRHPKTAATMDEAKIDSIREIPRQGS
jgi:hypothetical protein